MCTTASATATVVLLKASSLLTLLELCALGSICSKQFAGLGLHLHVSPLENRPCWSGSGKRLAYNRLHEGQNSCQTTVSASPMCKERIVWHLMFKTAARCLLWNSHLCCSCFVPDKEAEADWIKAEVPQTIKVSAEDLCQKLGNKASPVQQRCKP